MQPTTTYTVPDNLLQAIASALAQLPSGQTRGLLNALEHETTRQDRERAEAAAKAERDRVRNELKAELLAELEQRNPPPVQATAHDPEEQGGEGLPPTSEAPEPFAQMRELLSAVGAARLLPGH